VYANERPSGEHAGPKSLARDRTSARDGLPLPGWHIQMFAPVPGLYSVNSSVSPSGDQEPGTRS